MTIHTPKQSLKKAFLKVKHTVAEIENFKQKLHNYFDSLDTKQSEENNKVVFRDLLLSTHYAGYDINTDGRIDLALKEKSSANLQILFEVKRPSNTAEMITDSMLNRKAMQEILYYYMQELHTKNNTSLKQLIITNCHSVYIFDAQEFYRLFGKNTPLKKEFLEFEAGGATGGTTDYFYNNIAPKYLQSLDIECTKFSFDDYKNVDDATIVELYKILSPEHLLKLPFANDSNTLNTKFYSELLHIIGLEERAEKSGSSKKIIARKEEGKRNYGSLLENCLLNLKETNELDGLANKERYGDTQEEIEFAVAMELCIVWINRILFLKLLEGQLVSYNNNSPAHRFLNNKNFPEYDSLKGLFFGILAHSVDKRSPKYANFSHIPYLNSSLFEPTPLEVATIQISSLSDNLEIPLLSDTVLKDNSGSPIRGNKNTLEYLYEFLDAYDFSSNTNDVLTTEKKTLINASVLGLIFEKINGYKDGSFFTPGFITMYMCRETIERAVMQKFADAFSIPFASITDVANYLSRNNIDLKLANDIFNSITICDPAVGSGHFLVSSLNELIALKYRLNILIDRNARHISNQAYEIIVENDELIVLDEKRNLFQYNKAHPESQRIQETMFHEKQLLIERCLFGVDINENSVKICRLRLWIELLKYAYYRTDGSGLETLPNLDIKIKTGNSLLSRFPIDIDLKEGLRLSTHGIEGYKAAVQLYKKASSKKEKDDCLAIINQCKSEIRLHGEERHPLQLRLNTAVQELHKLNTEISFVEPSPKEKKQKDALEKTIATLSEEINNWKEKKQYANAFEWRFEFPEILDNDGNFLGFDIIIGNPPYIQLQKDGGSLGKLYEALNFETFASMGDIYSLFMEKGFLLTKSNGLMCMIISNKWMRAGYGENLRKFLTQMQGHRLIDLGPGIFDSATVDTCIYIGTNTKATAPFKAITIVKGEDVDTVLKERSVDFEPPISGDSWVIMNPIEQQIKQKIEQYGTPLKDWDIQINYGIKTGYNEAFIIDGATKDHLIAEDPKNAEIIKPLLKDNMIQAYRINFQQKYLINFHNGVRELQIPPINPDDYPSIVKYIDEVVENVESEKIKRKGGHTDRNSSFKTRTDRGVSIYNLRNCAYLDKFEYPKIIWKQTSILQTFAFDINNHFTDVTGQILTMKKDSHKTLKYLLSFLNSKLVMYLMKNGAISFGSAGVRWIPAEILQLPIPQISEEEQRPFEELVEQILTKKERGENTDAEERRIDEMVYSLYHLTPDEINHIEGKE
ncbi:MAG: class I SAM-dependent DNA methyltransferase [Candidatus Kapabacteria bacterium]|nr:class I SAM-dependent DNA methyltransferase [Candidatus Kapabacteria bacterium]